MHTFYVVCAGREASRPAKHLYLYDLLLPLLTVGDMCQSITISARNRYIFRHATPLLGPIEVSFHAADFKSHRDSPRFARLHQPRSAIAVGR